MIKAEDEKVYLAYYKLGIISIEESEIEKAKNHFLVVAEK